MSEVCLEKEEKKRDILESIWKSLASVKLAIFILMILALSSIIGTIVEQQAEPARNISLLAKFFGDSFAPTVYNIFVKLGFMDMYRSWWFVSFLVLFSINLVVCSIERLPTTWKIIKKPLKPMAQSGIKSLPVKKEIKLQANLSDVKDVFHTALKESRYNVFEAAEEGSIQLYTQRGGFARLGAYIVHISILLIFIGAIVGVRYGFKAHVNIPEGGTTSVAYDNNRKSIPLGFSVKCNWYDTTYYPDIDTPQEFSSELVVYDQGKEVMKKVIEVNSPLTYKGITFYQSSYGKIPDAVGHFVLDVSSPSGQEKTLWLRHGESFVIPGTEVKGRIVDFSTALTRDRHSNQLITYSDSMVNPAVAIEFEEPGRKKYTGWILKRYPETGNLMNGNKVIFKDYWGVEYTGLQVAKDPGVGIVYLGCLIMAAGLYISFFISHKKIWVYITQEGSKGKGPISVTVGGSTTKNRITFEQEIDKIIAKTSQAMEGRSKK
jgi:cytochrome c biogenesis protein